MLFKTLLRGIIFSLILVNSAFGQSVNPTPTWNVSARVFQDGPSGSFDDTAVKDPSIVYSGGQYHLFYTGTNGSNWTLGYTSATSLSGLNNSTRYYLSALNAGSYFAAPQILYFGVKGRWFLIYQSGLGASFSTNTDVGNPNGWTPNRSMGFSDGIDFWVISDGSMVYCFYSAQDGSRTIKRRSTTIANFPYSWSGSTTVATNTFEAPHVYKNLADGLFYMVVEDIGRYQELWRASSLGGSWTQVEEQWAHESDIIDQADHWTDQVSHIEIIRSGTNELLEVNNLNDCEMIFQGVLNGNYGDYINIPYDLGIARNGGGSSGGGSVYQLRNRGTGLYLDGLGHTNNGDACAQWANTTHPNSQWQFVDVGSGYTQLRNVGTGLYLDGMGRTANGDDVAQWINTTHPNSHWSVQQFDGNYYRLQNRSTGLYLDGMGRTGNGNACGQWGNTTHPNAQWQLISVSGARTTSSNEDIEETMAALYYPNPVNQVLNIRLDERDEVTKARIVNLSGQLIMSTDLVNIENQIDVSGLSEGVYFLEIATPSGVRRSKLIKE